MMMIAKSIPLTLFAFLVTSCLNQEVDPMECFQYSPEECLSKSEPQTCHNVPIEGWTRVYNIEHECNEYYLGSGRAFVCAPLDYEEFFTGGVADQSIGKVSPDGRLFVSPTTGNAWTFFDYVAPQFAPEKLYKSEDRPMCNSKDEHPSEIWQRIQERELAESNQ